MAFGKGGKARSQDFPHGIVSNILQLGKAHQFLGSIEVTVDIPISPINHLI